MAHLVERMAFSGRTPWHGLGATITNNTDIDLAFEQAGLNYEAKLERLVVNGIECPFANTITRSSDGACVGVVSDKYTILQTSDMKEWLRPWVESGKATVETAGTLKNGRVCWALLKVGGASDVGDGDTVERYILIAQSHDGKMSIRAGVTPIRVVCNNTLSAALGEGQSGIIKLAHTGKAVQSLEEFRQTMEANDLHWHGLVDRWRKMAETPIKSEDAVRAFVRAVYKSDAPEEGKRAPREDAIVELFEDGIGQDLSSAKGTAWGLYNALTEYVTHNAPTNKIAHDVEGRVNSLSYGQGRRLLNRGAEIVDAILDRRPEFEGLTADDLGLALAETATTEVQSVLQ